MLDDPKLFALLIDGDNVQIPFIPEILEKIEEYGNPIVKNVYLNRSSLTKDWDALVNEHTIQPIYVPNNTTRKNAVDIAITIDAMELLYENTDLYGFCIVSSDSDFTRLAARLVRKVKFVLGIGEDKTPTSFVKACSDFVRIEDLIQSQAPVKVSKPKPIQNQEKQIETDMFSGFEILLIQAYKNISQVVDGWVQLIEIKEEMKALNDDFQSSEYRNTRRFAEKIEEIGESFPNSVIEIKIFENHDTKQVIHYIRIDCEVFSFIEGYKQVPEKERGGWVLLSLLGTELKNYSVIGSRFRYRGITKLKDAVTQMSQDFPKLIKIREKIKENKAIDVVRVDL